MNFDAFLKLNPDYDDCLFNAFHRFFDFAPTLMIFVFIFFMLHIIFSFNTGYENRDNEIIFDRKKLIARYLRGGFWFDLLVSFPFNVFEGFPLIGDFLTKYQNQLWLMRLLRVFNIMEI